MTTVAVSRVAEVSDCGTYRYTLGRLWQPDLPTLTYIMLNPSTADGMVDDATIRVCVGRAVRMSCGGIWVVNLYAYRATQPAKMWQAQEHGTDIIGPENDAHIIAAAAHAHATNGKIICAWGHHGNVAGRAEQVRKLLRDRPLYHLGLTKHGDPRHPLHIAYAVPLTPFLNAVPN